METSFHPPSTLVSLLANYPHSHYSPPHWGPTFTHPFIVIPYFGVTGGQRSSCDVSCTFVLFDFCFGSKVTGVYHASFYWRHSVIDFLIFITKRSAIIRFLMKWGGGDIELSLWLIILLLHGLCGVFR